MRREAREARGIQLEQIEGYHGGGYDRTVVFLSDRPTGADDDYHIEKDGAPYLPKIFGYEVETQCWGILSDTVYANVLRRVALQNFHPLLWKVERDGSLVMNADTAAECITQPMTRAYIRNHYRDFKAMYDAFPLLGIDCARTGDCGMHIHISKTCFGTDETHQNEAARKLYYIVMRWRRTLGRAMGRTFADDHYYCGDDENRAWADDFFYTGQHCRAVNMSHWRRHENLELRLPGGQPDFESFRNTSEMVFHLVDACKKLEREECDDFVKIFRGCNQYVVDALQRVADNGYIPAERMLKIAAACKPVDW